MDHKFLAAALASPNPQQQLLKAWIDEQTGSSLQSVDALLKISSNFEIKYERLFSDKSRRDELKEAFEARNQIVHEMDLAFSATRSRRQRKIQDARNLTQQVFDTAAKFLEAVESQFSAPV